MIAKVRIHWAGGLRTLGERERDSSRSACPARDHCRAPTLKPKRRSPVLMSLQRREDGMKTIYAIALAGIVSLLAINNSMAQAGAGQTGGNAAGQGQGSSAGGGGAGGAGGK